MSCYIGSLNTGLTVLGSGLPIWSIVFDRYSTFFLPSVQPLVALHLRDMYGGYVLLYTQHQGSCIVLRSTTGSLKFIWVSNDKHQERKPVHSVHMGKQ